MNKLKFLTAFVLIFTAFNFTSCDNEPLDSAIDPNPQPSCVAPTSFQASNFIGGTNVNLSWVASSEATSWEVQYGPTGFAIGEGTSVFSDVTNVTITGLVSTNTYHFYVRSNCSESEVSSRIGPISVGTSTGGTPGVQQEEVFE
ncbi:fibronectin type III domain-containing protein [Flavobacterium lindanitolerans]|nr:fibronectin type III domain-containing protein [Flavobacterium lindanitolerans]